MEQAGRRTASISQRELIEWFEDVADRRAPATAVQLLSPDPSARRATLHGFYGAIARHPRFGGAWPASLPDGALTPALDGIQSGPPPEAMWLALVGSPHPYVEMGQLVDQLEQLKHFVHLDPWVNQAAAGEFRVVLSHAAMQGAGDAAALAFGFLDPQRNDGRVAGLASAVRVLDEVATRTRLGRDGGSLGVDGPRTRSRALVTAGWIERLSTSAPVVLVVDDAHHAGPFVVDVVRLLLDAPARVLVVLAGEPVTDPSTTAPAARTRLAGSLGDVHAATVAPVSLADDAGGRLAGALASVHPSGLFTTQHARRWAGDLALGDHRILLRDLTTLGWIRPITADVHVFSTTERLRVAREQASELVPSLTAAAQRNLTASVAAATTEDDELEHVVAVAAAAANARPDADARWHLATALAVRGQTGSAERIGRSAAGTASRRAAVATWNASGWADPLASAAARLPAAPYADTALTDDQSLALVIEAASAATHAERVGPLLAPVARRPDLDIGVRLAAARVLLAAGELEQAAHAIGSDAPEQLSAPMLAQLDHLATWRETPGLVARSVEVMGNLHAIAVLRRAVPDSVALGLVLIARLELLERYGRIESADDALAIAAEAVRIFDRTRDTTPTDRWLARRWQAWTRLRHGDVASALGDFAALLDEQRRRLGPADPTLIETQLWFGRALLVAARPHEAHTMLHEVREARRRTHLDDHTDLLAARQWHAASKVEAGDPVAAIDELEDVTRLRGTTVSTDDEDHLATQHLLGSALAAAGRWQEGLAVLDHVLARRSLLDLSDAPRVLGARYSRAACLVFLQRTDEALVELGDIVTLAEATADAAGVATKARNARAVSHLMAGSWDDALPDLDRVVAVLAERAPADDEVLNCARQQRAECLRMLDRTGDAVRDLDEVLLATAGWAPDHALVVMVRRQRAELGMPAPGVAPR